MDNKVHVFIHIHTYALLHTHTHTQTGLFRKKHNMYSFVISDLMSRVLFFFNDYQFVGLMSREL